MATVGRTDLLQVRYWIGRVLAPLTDLKYSTNSVLNATQSFLVNFPEFLVLHLLHQGWISVHCSTYKIIIGSVEAAVSNSVLSLPHSSKSKSYTQARRVASFFWWIIPNVKGIEVECQHLATLLRSLLVRNSIEVVLLLSIPSWHARLVGNAIPHCVSISYISIWAFTTAAAIVRVVAWIWNYI